MLGKFNRVCARSGGTFDCYLVTPKAEKPMPAIVLASAIHGVDADMLAIDDKLAASGLIVANGRNMPGHVENRGASAKWCSDA